MDRIDLARQALSDPEASEQDRQQAQKILTGHREELARQAINDPEATDQDRAQAQRILYPAAVTAPEAQAPAAIESNQPTPSGPPAPPAGAESGEPLSLTIGKILGTAQNIGKEAFSEILPPEIMGQIFGGTEAGLREEEKTGPLLSPEISRAIVGELPTWAGGGTALGRGIAEGGAESLSAFSRPGSLAQLPAFAVPGVAETFALNTAANVPRQVRQVQDIIREHGINSKEAGIALADYALQDVVGLLAGKESTAGRAIGAAREIARTPLGEAAPPAPAEVAPAEAPAAEVVPGPNGARPIPEQTLPLPEDRSATAQADLDTLRRTNEARLAGATPIEGDKIRLPIGNEPQVLGTAYLDEAGNPRLAPSDRPFMPHAGVGTLQEGIEPAQNRRGFWGVGEDGRLGFMSREEAARIAVRNGQAPEGTKALDSGQFTPEGEPVYKAPRAQMPQAPSAEARPVEEVAPPPAKETPPVVTQPIEVGPKPETPVQAEQKIETGIIKTVADPKEAKAQLITRIRGEIERTRQDSGVQVENLSATDPTYYAITHANGENLGHAFIERSDSGGYETSFRETGKTTRIKGDTLQEVIDQVKDRYSVAPGKVTIEIPGDGVFTVLRAGKTLTELLTKAERLETSGGGKESRPSKKPASPTRSEGQTYADQLIADMGKDAAIADQEAQLGQVKPGSPAARMIKEVLDHLRRYTPPTPEEEAAGAAAAPALPPSGPATAGATLAPGPINVPILKIKSQREITTDIANALGVTTRFGRLKLGRQFGGAFWSRKNLIGLKRAIDLPVMTHEGGHKLDDLLGLRKVKAIRDELMHLGDPNRQGSRSSMTKSKPLDYQRGEGVAEFVRYWMTDPATAKQLAPVMYDFFENVLDVNKDLGDSFRQAQRDIQIWKASEPQARLRSHISVGENPNKTPYTFSQLMRDFVDDLHFGKLATGFAEKMKGSAIPPSKNLYVLARLLRGSYGMADTWVRKGMVDFKTKEISLGTSLEDALKPVAGRLDEFRDYMVARRARELHSQGKETGLSAGDVGAVLDRYKNDTDFQTSFDNVKRWNRALLLYGVDSGLVTPDSALKMLKMHEDYVPFHRLFEIGAGEPPSMETLGTGRGLNVGTPASLRSMSREGSTREIVDPIETLIQNAYAIVTASEKTAINHAVADYAKLPGMAKYVEEVAPPKEKVTVGLDKLRSQLEHLGADLEDVPEDNFPLSFWKKGSEAPYGENIIRVDRAGKSEFYRLNKDLFDTFNALDFEDAGKIWQILSQPSQLLRAGVTLEPSFAVANVLRDTLSSAVIGKFGALPFEAPLKGIAAILKDPKLVAEWAASGGKNSVEASYFDRKALQRYITEKISGDLTPAERALVVLKSPLTALRYLTGAAEEATRIGEYKIAYEKLIKSGMPEGEARRMAAFESRDRQDFAKGGAKTKILRRLAAFWNAGLQGNVKLIDSIRQRPIRTIAQGLAFITLPKMLEQAINWNDDDYWQRPQWERDLFFMIPVNKDATGHIRFIRIPIPFEAGLMGATIPGRFFQWMKFHKSEAFGRGLVNTIFQQSVPNPMPQAAQVVFENLPPQGYDIYRGRPIVPDYLKDMPPDMQWTDQTSRLAKFVGGLAGISPLKIDHLIDQTTGGMGKLLTGRRLPGQRFLTAPLAVSNQATDDFYNTLEALRQQKARNKGEFAEEPAGLKEYEAAARQMSELRVQSRKTSDPDEKLQLQDQIYQIARRTVEEHSD